MVVPRTIEGTRRDSNVLADSTFQMLMGAADIRLIAQPALDLINHIGSTTITAVDAHSIAYIRSRAVALPRHRVQGMHTHHRFHSQVGLKAVPA